MATLNWSVVEEMPHSHITGGRVLRITAEYSNAMLQMLDSGTWLTLFTIECDDDHCCESVVARLKAYAEFLFLGPS